MGGSYIPSASPAGRKPIPPSILVGEPHRSYLILCRSQEIIGKGKRTISVPHYGIFPEKSRKTSLLSSSQRTRAESWQRLDFIVWGSLFINITLPLIIFAVSANIANFTMAISALLTIRLNRKVLPKEYRPALWREIILVLNIIFFGFFFSLFILARLGLKL
jgi:hypothetical protein